jgi:MIP family channel proteins
MTSRAEPVLLGAMSTMTQPRPAPTERTREEPGRRRSHEMPDLPRQMIAEIVGTFCLTFVAAGGEVIASIAGDDQVTQAARAVAPGLTVMAMIYAMSDVSGAHFNPAVTLSFALRGGFPWTRVPFYWAAEFAGAIIAALVLLATFGDTADLGTTFPHHGVGASLVMEIILTSILISVILGTATRKGTIGTQAAIAVGGTIALCGLFAAPISGASMNPARSLGPALVSGALHDSWIYLVGPLLGACIATGITWALRGDPQ